MGTISYAININWKLVTITANPILNLFIKTRNDYSLVVNSTKSLYQLGKYLDGKLELGLNNIITSYVLLDT